MTILCPLKQRYGFPLFIRGLKILDLSTHSCSQYSQLLWKTTNPVQLNRTNAHLKAPNHSFSCCQSWINTACILHFVHEVANTVDHCLIIQRYMSTLLLFFMISMVVTATLLMFCSKCVLHLPVWSSIKLWFLVWKSCSKILLFLAFSSAPYQVVSQLSVAIDTHDLNDLVCIVVTWNRVEIGVNFSRL